MIDRYDWSGGSEAMLRFGPDTSPVVVAAMPLLEEWNRTRAFTATLLRALADRGVGSVLPDLPGHGESPVAIADLTLTHIAGAFASLTDRLIDEGRVSLALGIRSGALIDAQARCRGRWHLAPMTGADLLGDLDRIRLAGARGREPAADPVTIAGHTLSARFLTSLAEPAPPTHTDVPGRVVRLSTDPRPADRHVDGAPLWRRAEPGNDPALAALLADDIAVWAETCAA